MAGITITDGKTLTVSDNANVSGTNTGDVTLTGQNYLSLTGQQITANPIDLSGVNATGTLAAARLPALTGDVTSSAGSAVTTIANDAVTYAKMQNVSAASRLLGRGAGVGAGNVQEITISGGLSMSGTVLSSTGGTVTSVATGDGLTGGPITGSGTISFAPNGLSTVTPTSLDSLVIADQSDGGNPKLSTVASLGAAIVATGTWTPVLTFATPGNLSVSYIAQAGTYMKIGPMVIAQFGVVTSSFTHTTASGDLQVTGLPFTSFSAAWITGTGAGSWQGINKTGYTDVIARIGTSSNTIFLQASGPGQAQTTVLASDVPSGGAVTLYFTLVFQASS